MYGTIIWFLRLIFLSVYYIFNADSRIIYFLRTRYILLSDRNLFYTRRKMLEVSLKVSSTQSTIIVGSPLERNTEESAPTPGISVCVRIDSSVRAERVRRADFIVHVVWHQCEIWGWFQTHDKAISNWITDFWAHNKMHLPQRFAKPRKGDLSDAMCAFLYLHAWRTRIRTSVSSLIRLRPWKRDLFFQLYFSYPRTYQLFVIQKWKRLFLRIIDEQTE